MAEFGIGMLALAFGLCLYAVISSAVKLRLTQEVKFDDIRQASILSVIAVTGAVFILQAAFVTDNFRLAYVAQYSESSLSLVYKISALWAGQSGSLLLWLLLVSLAALGLHLSKKYRSDNTDIKLGLVVNAVRISFIVLLLFVSSPFETVSLTPRDGSGLNPMLQSFGMVVHPPILFLGYSLMLVPFAFAVVGLFERSEGDAWLKASRPWVLAAWAALTAGIVTGGHWAYTELGWGGYWAWDPVENASLLPWLTLTALVHTYLLPHSGWQKKLWSYLLILTSFGLAFFGSFLTRSGILDSVHAFAHGLLGYAFLALLAVVVCLGFYLLISRRSLLLDAPDQKEGSSWLTRSGSIVVGNGVLVFILAAVLIGTITPLISRTFGSREMVMGEEYYNFVSVPLFLAVVFLMGLAPLWHGNRRLKLAVAAGAGVIVLAAVLIRSGHLLASISFALGAFALFTHLTELVLDWLAGGVRRRKAGAYLVHLGIVLMVFGIAGSSVFDEEVLVSVKPGEIFEFGGYEFRFGDVLDEWTERDYAVTGTLAVYKGGQYIGKVTSKKTFTDPQKAPYTDIGILSRLTEDLYLNLAGRTPDYIQFHIQRFPLINLIWIGSCICYLGIFVILIPLRKRR